MINLFSQAVCCVFIKVPFTQYLATYGNNVHHPCRVVLVSRERKGDISRLFEVFAHKGGEKDTRKKPGNQILRWFQITRKMEVPVDYLH